MAHHLTLEERDRMRNCGINKWASLANGLRASASDRSDMGPRAATARRASSLASERTAWQQAAPWSFTAHPAVPNTPPPPLDPWRSSGGYRSSTPRAS